MKQKLRNLVNDLLIAEPLPPCDLKSRQVNAFFNDIAKIGLINEPGRVFILSDHTVRQVRICQFVYCDYFQKIDVRVNYFGGADFEESLVIIAVFGED